MSQQNNTIALFDLDSLLYRAVHKAVSVSEIREQLKSVFVSMNRKQAKAAIREWIVENCFCKLEQMTFKILEDASKMGAETDQVELYISFCPLSERKKIEPSYKSNRQPNLWVNRLRAYIVDKSNMEVKSNLKWEADDLIANRAKALRNEGIDYVVFAIDKDLRQIEGTHFNYDFQKSKVELVGELSHEEYKDNWREIQNSFLVEKTKETVHLYKFVWIYKGLDVVTKEQARELLLKQLIMGDSVDNIKGVPKLGEVKANKILAEHSNDFERVKAIFREYKKFYGVEAKSEFRKNYQLIKIGL